jgi:hypothetical protein
MNTDEAENLDDAKLVTVAERPSEGGAAVLVAVLQDAGIRAVATGGFTAGFRAEAPGWVRVQTLERDAERARKILAEIKMERPEALDESEPSSE